ncbi:hypothetical protein PISMIDRAFT_675160 [Pisolithus microcarpus 441]|uniref:Uncharacterized protein n=1 Tax=Pisolithus microcarpus 441 TaxID=765257 RepID=A0A0C9ZYH9_9AGAM|nr:hypothetical protein BKA83DRAFT_675160 [Pisolithus microcarpus]KIK27282.1 hypothetical protein PISMIDRAFT_675160 [Pisolithus microcarpus 441]
MRSRSNRPHRTSTSPNPRPQRTNTIHWLFSSNLPHRRRSAALSADIGRRNIFGMSEIFGVLMNPSETVRSLTESKRLLEEARKEIKEERERSQLRTKHTFTRLPGFFHREAEIRAIDRALGSAPSFTVVFGASSVGKTALIREVLSNNRYHVLHFDLRIPGFADVFSLYMSLSQQMEQYFEEIAANLPGFEEFRKEAWGFKHDRLNVERRISEAPVGSVGSQVRTSDVARLMELFQSSLLRYAEFEPLEGPELPLGKKGSDVSSDQTQVNHPSALSRTRWFFHRNGRRSCDGAREVSSTAVNSNPREKDPEKFVKKMPVLFFDEAHRLPALIQSVDTMRCLLDSMLALTKQDRLCHVIHATSDPFYHTWLRQLNVMQHCKIITVGDCSKAEMRAFFFEHLLPRVPETLRHALSFELLYEAFGGKLAHWQDYIDDYVSAGGNFDIKQSAHFLQAHAILNLHIIHSSQISGPPGQDPITPSTPAPRPRSSGPDALHAALGPAGFKSYSSARESGVEDYSADFSAMQLLKVMSKLSQPSTTHLPYFLLCREIGVRAVDGMVKGRVLDLHWTDPVGFKDTSDQPTVREPGSPVPMTTRMMSNSSYIGAASGTVGVESSEDGDMVMVNPINLSTRELGQIDEADEQEIVGPRLVPVTPIMRFAMREVVQEYEDVRTVSEYASLNDPDEY